MKATCMYSTFTVVVAVVVVVVIFAGLIVMRVVVCEYMCVHVIAGR
jgi:hypothetical protein